MATYIFRTDDYGQTWQSLVGDGIRGYAWVIKQDPVNPELLYAGTEFGLYISLDGGQQWARFKENLPMVAVHDLAIHPTEHDLIVGTHGRGIYIVDDLTALRSLTTEILESNVAVLPSRPSPMVLTGFQDWFGSDDEFVGRNPTEAATIDYWLKKRHLFGDLKIEVYDADGELITTLPGWKRRGLNRVGWPMRLKPPKVPPATALVPAFLGPRVPEGTYTFKLIKGKEILEGTVELVADPRNPHPKEDRLLQQKTALEVYETLGELTFLVDSVTGLHAQVEERAGSLRGKDKQVMDSYAKSLDTLHQTLVVTEGGWISGREELRERLGTLYGDISFYDGRPTDSQLERLDRLQAELEEKKDQFEAEVQAIERINRMLARRDLEPVKLLTRDEWEKQQEGAGGSASEAGLVSLGLLMGF
jgi:hypothetical protein